MIYTKDDKDSTTHISNMAYDSAYARCLYREDVMYWQGIYISVGVRKGSVNDFLIPFAEFSFDCIWPYCTWS